MSYYRTAAVRDGKPVYGRNGARKWGEGAGEVAVSEISESIVEVLEILRDHLWSVSSKVSALLYLLCKFTTQTLYGK